MDKADRDDVKASEGQLAMIAGEPEVAQEVRDDYADMVHRRRLPRLRRRGLSRNPKMDMLDGTWRAGTL